MPKITQYPLHALWMIALLPQAASAFSTDEFKTVFKSLYWMDCSLILPFVAMFLYTLVLGSAVIVRKVRCRRTRNAEPLTKPIWKKKAVIPLLFWPFVLWLIVPEIVINVQRHRQSKSMKDLRQIGSVVGNYAIDHNAYPEANSIEELARILEPHYIKTLPLKDGWGNPYCYTVRGLNEKYGPQEYIIVSTGRDGVAETRNVWSYPSGATYTFENDIVFTQASFIRYPEGIGGMPNCLDTILYNLRHPFD